MVKCELCKCVDVNNSFIFLNYSKGDFFCIKCYHKVKGMRTCVVCGDEFYYSVSSKKLCGSLKCSCAYYNLKRKLNNNSFLTISDKINIKNWF